MVGVHIVTLCGVGLLCLAYPLIQQSAYQCNSCDRIEAAGCYLMHTISTAFTGAGVIAEILSVSCLTVPNQGPTASHPG